MPGAREPGLHDRFRGRVAGGDVLRDRTPEVPGARDAFRCRTAVGPFVRHPAGSRHVTRVRRGDRPSVASSTSGRRRRERLVAAAPRLSARLVDERERAARDDVRIGHRGRLEWRCEHDPQVVTPTRDADRLELGVGDVGAEPRVSRS